MIARHDLDLTFHGPEEISILRLTNIKDPAIRHDDRGR